MKDEEVVEAIVIRDEPGMGALRSSIARSRGSEMTAVWGVVAMVGMAVGGYLIVKSARSTPAPGPAPAPVAATPGPKAGPAAKRPGRRVRVMPAGIVRTEATRPAVVNHVEPEKKAVDPREGFETGEAFDNPPSPGRYGRLGSGLLERATPAPNVPDPSFERDRR